MSIASLTDRQTPLDAAVHRHAALSSKGVLERLFTLAFRDLVYAQIWEDPEIDMEALELRSDSVLVGIASGGCNLLSYLTAGPQRIHGVDLNAAHVALNRLKLAALVTLPDHDAFYRFVGSANHTDCVTTFDRLIAPQLDPASLAYWNGRDYRGRRNISAFTRNIYRTGLLGRFIGAAHSIAKLYGLDPRALAVHRRRESMVDAFETKVAPLFEKRLIKLVLGHPLSLYGLGIPPAQYEALGNGAPHMAVVVRERLRKLLCDFDLDDNYFAVQALTRTYDAGGSGPLPPYLQRRHFEVLRQRADRLDVQQVSMTDMLAARPPRSVDRYVLLDAQDWMSDAQLEALWRQICRTARPCARVIFRTADVHPLLPGRLADDLLGQWRYEHARSADLFRRDRSAIYGGFHLYVRKG